MKQPGSHACDRDAMRSDPINCVICLFCDLSQIICNQIEWPENTNDGKQFNEIIFTFFCWLDATTNDYNCPQPPPLSPCYLDIAISLPKIYTARQKAARIVRK